MSFILSAPVLVLNKHWAPIGETTVERSIVDMMGDPPSKMAMNVEMQQDRDGKWILASGSGPVPFEDWLRLPVRNDHHQDRILHTGNFAFRGPTVLICTGYDKMPRKQMRWSVGNVWVRDNGTCQVTGRKLSRAEGNVGHDKARAKGGRDEWNNVALIDRRLNTIQGTKSFAEMGWKLLKQPKAPPALPASVTIRVAKHIQWEPFIL
jgi:5-methylcytosine-specific restriction endonuclease McrA